MEIRIRKIDSQSIHEVDQFDHKFTVNSKLVLSMDNGKLIYSISSVPPYEKEMLLEAADYTTFFENPERVIFFADVQGKLAGQIKVISWWNKFAYIENLIVNPENRGQGVGRALLANAIDWAKSNNFPGIMLEAQDDNVPACRLYESCGFELAGFDRYLYKGLSPSTDQIALYWYLVF